ncbi:MAG: Nif11-like leader peptide family RiPP precursor [Synergistaceae bacterium]|nr:Nif11-like leader peptide family RiPP precursor [Synergistaceae bacterium]
MSVENLKKYGQLCAENEEVRHRAKEIGTQDLEGHIAHAYSLGLEFSKADFEALAKEAGISGKDELSEDDLKKVAGGAVTLTLLVSGAVMAAVGAGVGAVAINKPRW